MNPKHFLFIVFHALYPKHCSKLLVHAFDSHYIHIVSIHRFHASKCKHFVRCILFHEFCSMYLLICILIYANKAKRTQCTPTPGNWVNHTSNIPPNCVYFQNITQVFLMFPLSVRLIGWKMVKKIQEKNTVYWTLAFQEFCLYLKAMK